MVFAAQAVLLAYLAGPYSEKLLRSGQAVRTTPGCFLQPPRRAARAATREPCVDGLGLPGHPSLDLNWSLPVLPAARGVAGTQTRRRVPVGPAGCRAARACLASSCFPPDPKPCCWVPHGHSWWLARSLQATESWVRETHCADCPAVGRRSAVQICRAWLAVAAGQLDAFDAPTGESDGHPAGIRAAQVAGAAGFTLAVLVQVAGRPWHCDGTCPGVAPEPPMASTLAWRRGSPPVFAAECCWPRFPHSPFAGLHSAGGIAADPADGWSTGSLAGLRLGSGVPVADPAGGLLRCDRGPATSGAIRIPP